MIYEEFWTHSAPAEISVQVLRFVCATRATFEFEFAHRPSLCTIDGVMAVGVRITSCFRPPSFRLPVPRFLSLPALVHLISVAYSLSLLCTTSKLSQASHSNYTRGDDLRDSMRFVDRRSKLEEEEEEEDSFHAALVGLIRF